MRKAKVFIVGLFVGLFTFAGPSSARVTLFGVPEQVEGVPVGDLLAPSPIIAPSTHGVWVTSTNGFLRLRAVEAYTALEYDLEAEEVLLASNSTNIGPPEEIDVSVTITSLSREEYQLDHGEEGGFWFWSQVSLPLAVLSMSFDSQTFPVAGPHQKVGYFDPFQGKLILWDISGLHLEDEDPTVVQRGPNNWIWFLEKGTARLAAIDPDEDQVHEWEIPGAVGPNVLLVKGEEIWIGDLQVSYLWRFDPALNRFERWTLPEGNRVMALSAGEGDAVIISLWNAYSTENRLGTFELSTFTTFTLPGTFGSAYKVFRDPFGRIIAANLDLALIGRLDPATGQFLWANLLEGVGDGCGYLFSVGDVTVDPEGNIWFVAQTSFPLYCCVGLAPEEQCCWEGSQNFIGVLHHGAYYTLYLPHFHSGGGWWTGVALQAASAEEPVKVRICALSDDGTFLGAYEEELQPCGKLVDMISTLFPDLPFPTGWLKVVSEAPLRGFVLYGQGTSVAGVAGSARSDVLLQFPHFHSGGSWWTGVAILNPDLMVNNLQVGAFGEDGDILGNTTWSLQPFEKRALLIPDLFPGLTEEQGSVVVSPHYFGATVGLEVFGQQGGGITGVRAEGPMERAF